MLHVTVPIKQLKSALVDFYSVESLSEAKVQLLYDIQIKSNQIKSNQIYLTTQKSKINKQMKMKK